MTLWYLIALSVSWVELISSVFIVSITLKYMYLLGGGVKGNWSTESLFITYHLLLPLSFGKSESVISELFWGDGEERQVLFIVINCWGNLDLKFLYLGHNSQIALSLSGKEWNQKRIF